MEENKDMEVNFGDLTKMVEPKSEEKVVTLPKLSDSQSMGDMTRPFTAEFRTSRTLLPIKLPSQHSVKDLSRLENMMGRHKESEAYDELYRDLDNTVKNKVKEWGNNKARMEEESMRRRESMRFGNRFESRGWRPQTA